MRHDIPPDVESWVNLRLVEFAYEHKLIDEATYDRERLRLGALYRINQPPPVPTRKAG